VDKPAILRRRDRPVVGEDNRQRARVSPKRPIEKRE
jgi:hypothetical protein